MFMKKLLSNYIVNKTPSSSSSLLLSTCRQQTKYAIPAVSSLSYLWDRRSCYSSTTIIPLSSFNNVKQGYVHQQKKSLISQPLHYHHYRRCFSTSNSQLSSPKQPIRILYASQTGSAMLFAQELGEALKELEDIDEEQITIESWKDAAGSDGPSSVVRPGKAIHVFLVSVTGVGQPPENGKEFYDWIMNQQVEGGIAWKELEYTIFGLGNSKAHPNHYNVIAKHLDEKLATLGCQRIMELGLGDDGDCIEDDFDQYVENILALLKQEQHDDDDSKERKEEIAKAEISEESLIEAEMTVDDLKVNTDSQENRIVCPPGVSLREDNTRLISEKRQPITLLPPKTDIVCDDLFHLQGTKNQFYKDDVQEWQVVSNQSLAPRGGDTALHEMKIHLQPERYIHYETGDHIMIYPRNSQVIVEAYVDRLDINRHCIIADTDQAAEDYPFPKGLTVFETLSHCVDLGAVPSPTFTRLILGHKNFDYKEDIAYARRTVIDLLGEMGPDKKIALEDLLYNLPVMKLRYYSIASSSLERPNEIVLAFRPTKYMSNRGILREGVCTSYMMHQASAALGSAVDNTTATSIPAIVSSNPSFRLPKDTEIPILMIAGGCGVAPIRAFIEERIAMNASHYGPCRMYLGFRSPEDEVYQPLIEKALTIGAMTEAKITYSQGCREPHQHCMMVSDQIRISGQDVWDHFESGGYTFICGGARHFGAAVEAEIMNVLQEYGKMSWEDSENYLRNLVEEGRFCEDLAD